MLTTQQIKNMKPEEIDAYLAKQNAGNLPVAQPPINAGAVVKTNPVTIPTKSPYYGDISNAISTTAGVQSNIDTQAQMRADQLKMEKETIAQTESGKNEASFLSKFLGNKSPTEARSEAVATTGIDPAQYFAEQKTKIAEIESLTKDYNTVKASMEKAIAGLEGQGRGITVDILNNKKSEIERNAAPSLNMISANINAKTATLQALQGNFNEAQNFVNQAVQDVTATSKFNLDMYSAFKTINEEAFSALDEPYKKAYNQKLKQMEDEHNQITEDKKTLGELLISNPQAGISMNDTLDQAYAKIGLKPKTSNQIIGSAETGYSNVITDANGKVISISSVKGGGSGSKTTTSLDKDAQLYLDGVLTDEDFKDKDYLRSIKAKANDIATALIAKTNVPTSPKAPVTAYQAGKNITSSPLYQAFHPENLGAGVKGVANTVESFFSGLFGN